MEAMDELIDNWLDKDWAEGDNFNQYCNGLRVEPNVELTLKYNKVETPFNRVYNDEYLIVDYDDIGDKTIVK